ncbi:hypothetical protein Cylst_1497 [Cylindrospermum stagnale PCC 7417]|uniref:DSP-PTPase phosphatase fused to NAD+ Kinase domain-containing protein n=1 Tax=Cylindrospermum stagnale PCC 7417 TaxID=56107 RepID=K9WVG8_9NOST|nr:protein tyrosine phosphatase family protein [Cylindrospermum stagnale]AFZ23781.1 hypothetical protein Cylst_1497 [Cylindrospermum stagnale PCC 7417]
MSTNGIEDISNFLKISDVIATSGQPTAKQFAVIKQSGYQLIINLALPTSNNALSNEQEIVESQGMEYVNIPVLWENPTIEDLTEFFSLMATNADKKIFVHCAANMRVSAFMYLYRRLHQGINETEARQTLHQVWIPNEIWHKFIEEAIEYLFSYTFG